MPTEGIYLRSRTEDLSEIVDFSRGHDHVIFVMHETNLLRVRQIVLDRLQTETLDQCLQDMLQRGIISKQDAKMRAANKDDFA